MQYQEFINAVQQRTDLPTNEEVTAITRATLETLSERMAYGAPANLAAQLPAEIGAFITNHKSDATADFERFDVQEFVRRVAERSGIGDIFTAQHFASAVLAVVQDAVSREEFDKVRATFPDEYNALFEAESSEAMSTRY